MSRIVSDCVGSNGAGFVASNGMRESGAILAEIGLCYIVRDWRDIGSCCKKGYFAVYGETTPKIIARGCPL